MTWIRVHALPPTIRWVVIISGLVWLLIFSGRGSHASLFAAVRFMVFCRCTMMSLTSTSNLFYLMFLPLYAATASNSQRGFLYHNHSVLLCINVCILLRMIWLLKSALIAIYFRFLVWTQCSALFHGELLCILWPRLLKCQGIHLCEGIWDLQLSMQVMLKSVMISIFSITKLQNFAW